MKRSRVEIDDAIDLDGEEVVVREEIVDLDKDELIQLLSQDKESD